MYEIVSPKSYGGVSPSDSDVRIYVGRLKKIGLGEFIKEHKIRGAWVEVD